MTGSTKMMGRVGCQSCPNKGSHSPVTPIKNIPYAATVPPLIIDLFIGTGSLSDYHLSDITTTTTADLTATTTTTTTTSTTSSTTVHEPPPGTPPPPYGYPPHYLPQGEEYDENYCYISGEVSMVGYASTILEPGV